jgi:hypothetical protein
MMLVMKYRFMIVGMILFVSVNFSFTACSESFNPFQDNERYSFSIYGYLDAAADTQWVRIMPVRQSNLLSPEPLEITVTLEHIHPDGETSVLKDSLFYYGQNAYAWNYWTTTSIEPAQTYRLRVENVDGSVSSVTVTLPEDFPDPVIELDLEESEEYVIVSGVRNLADVHSGHLLYHQLSNVTTLINFKHHQDSLANFSDQDRHKILLNPSEARNFLEIYIEENPYTLIQREVYVASAGPDWYFFPDIFEEVIQLPDGISNVENGVGYVAGIVSKRVPWVMHCFEDELDDFGNPVANPCSF